MSDEQKAAHLARNMEWIRLGEEARDKACKVYEKIFFASQKVSFRARRAAHKVFDIVYADMLARRDVIFDAKEKASESQQSPNS